MPAHVVQRGNNREACFFQAEAYLFYSTALQDALQRYAGALRAYVLMTNHVHLLLTRQDAEGISRALQHTGRLYVRPINTR